MNFSVATQGRQFDRLGIMYLGDVEVFRTSTSEPVPDGIVWSYVKEMGQYRPLWKTEQKIIFDLPNIVNDVYTGPLDTVLTATFYTANDDRSAANIILPISAQRSAEGRGSAFTVPSGDPASTSHIFPPNVQRAVISLSACGQQAEEFWYSNVLSSDAHTFVTPSNDTAGTLGGFSPFREVQLLIDGQLAGISWPFPIIFTGGIVPGLWSPIAGIDAYDLRQHEIDVTPWLGMLCDGAAHSFEITVIGLDDDGAGYATLSETVGDYWVVTGTIFLFLGENGSITKGSKTSVSATLPTVSVSSSSTQDLVGANESLTYFVHVERSFSVQSFLTISSDTHPVSWTQHLAYRNQGRLTSKGLDQTTNQVTTGTDASSSGYFRNYAYPLKVKSSYREIAENGIMLNGTIERGLSYLEYGPSIFPGGFQCLDETIDGVNPHPNVKKPRLPNKTSAFKGSALDTSQTGTASYERSPSLNDSFGTTTQDFTFRGTNQDVVFYNRHVKAVNRTVTEDDSRFNGIALPTPTASAITDRKPIPFSAAEDGGVRAVLGRGPGKPKQGFCRFYF